MVSNGLDLGSIAAEREARLASRRGGGGETATVFEAALVNVPSDNQLVLTEAFDFARGLNYTHPGLTPSAYLAHPVRVMDLVVRLFGNVNLQAAVLALLHNVYEVSRVTEVEVSERFGAEIAGAIAVLTVDRSDTSPESVARYYAQLEASPEWVRVVKVCDKLDNLFVLGLNPDDEVRARYLADVERYLRPLAEGCVPQVVPYLDDLVADCRERGAFSLDG